MYMMLADEPAFAALDFSQLKCCIAGAAPFPGPSFTRLERIVGQGKLVEVYGMTEASPLVSMNPLHGKKKTGTVGIPLPCTAVRLYDLETGTREVAPGEEGEIAVRGPQVMKGYLGKPEETARALREHDGETWLHTGDVARMDDDGYLTVVDRCKDMVIVSGYKVFSSEVEEKLSDHPAIAVCAVIGLPNPDRPGSERVKLFVQRSAAQQRRPEAQVREELLAFAAGKLAPFKVPKIVEFVDELPLTPLGKVDKKALRGRT
jgi:acyl-CoA synthetase (AMP-forming)/AMP-acid ligase II